METSSGAGHTRRRFPPLKPSLVEWKHVRFVDVTWVPVVLETFLSGMESAVALERYGMPLPLKPSLVEWKRSIGHLEPVFVHALKPSLVEWKPTGIPHQPQAAAVLETFLSGMETWND